MYTELYTNLVMCRKRGIFVPDFKASIMEILTVREYRNKLAASFDRADEGEKVLIRRKNGIYALVRVGREEELMLTPELQARIEEAERECREGRCVTCSTHEELGTYLDSL